MPRRPRPAWLKQRRRLDQKITIMRRGGGTNELNEPTNELEVVFETRAAAYPSPGAERYDAAQTIAVQFMTFEVRSEERTRSILPSDAVRWDSNGGQMFNIVAPVEQPERGSNLRISAAADRS
jgi:head-tail adaptor